MRNKAGYNMTSDNYQIFNQLYRRKGVCLGTKINFITERIEQKVLKICG